MLVEVCTYGKTARRSRAVDDLIRGRGHEVGGGEVERELRKALQGLIVVLVASPTATRSSHSSAGIESNGGQVEGLHSGEWVEGLFHKVDCFKRWM